MSISLSSQCSARWPSWPACLPGNTNSTVMTSSRHKILTERKGPRGSTFHLESSLLQTRGSLRQHPGLKANEVFPVQTHPPTHNQGQEEAHSPDWESYKLLQLQCELAQVTAISPCPPRQVGEHSWRQQGGLGAAPNCKLGKTILSK